MAVGFLGAGEGTDVAFVVGFACRGAADVDFIVGLDVGFCACELTWEKKKTRNT